VQNVCGDSSAENRILRAKIKGRLQLSDGEKRTLSEIAHQLGRKALAEVAVAAKPDTILRWFRKLVARKFDGSARRQSVGRPRVEKTIEDLIVRMAQENPSWGYDRMVGALANLGHSVSDQTVGNVLSRDRHPEISKSVGLHRPTLGLLKTERSIFRTQRESAECLLR
jgi:hypothetical protein